MDPQIDTAQRRVEATAIQLCEKWFEAGARASWCPAMANDFAQALQQARREALQEARDYALACVSERKAQAFELTKTVINDPRAVWLGCKASEAERIAEWLDRLACEGVK